MARSKGSLVNLPCTYKQWPEIKLDLRNLAEKKLRGVSAFEDVCKKHDRWEQVNTPFSLLRRVLSDATHVTEEFFCETLLPWIAGKALQVEELFKDANHQLPTLSKVSTVGVRPSPDKTTEVSLTRQQVCCLLALGLFNVLEPMPGTDYQQLTFIAFLGMDFYGSQRSKLVCLLKYFERLMDAEKADNQEFLAMNISVARKRIAKSDPDLFWGKSAAILLPLEPQPKGLIEDAHGCLQVDFANAYIGGGVLGLGNVQEEIRFVINPECLVSMLFCNEMQDDEAILICGAEQFSTYSGYGGKFKYTGPYEDTNPVDVKNRRCVSIVAIDAIPFSFGGTDSQYFKGNILRELNKAYCGFSFETPNDKTSDRKLAPLATGNWGCGAFGGDKEIKTLIQWMAASQVGRSTRYYTFNDKQLGDRQKEVVKVLLEHKLTVGKLYAILTSGKLSKGNVFKHVIEKATKL